MTVSPCPRASSDRIPAEEIIFRISEARQAKDKPEEPAPWWVMKRGPPEVGEVIYAENIVVGELRDGRWRWREKCACHGMGVCDVGALGLLEEH